MMRAVLIAVLVVLACATVSASSADWSAPEALWSSDLSASELEARHSEFLMDLTASSSSGPSSPSISSSSSGPSAVVSSSSAANVVSSSSAANVASSSSAADVSSSSSAAEESSSSSSSTADAQSSTTTKVGFAVNCANATSCDVSEASVTDLTTKVLGFPDTEKYPGEAVTVTITSASASSSTGVAGRRLLQSGGQSNVDIGFTGSSVDGGAHATSSYSAFVALLQCTTDACRQSVKQTYNLPGDVSSFSALAAAVVPGSLAVNGQPATGTDNTSREVATVGGPRRTNIGYYVLGAVALAFAVAALIYFIAHRRPASHATIIKENRHAPEEVRMAPIVAAPVAATGVQYTPEVEEPAAGYQQQDYKSVFALKHNVLEQKAQEEEDHNHNDVHFILHQ